MKVDQEMHADFRKAILDRVVSHEVV